MLQIVWQSVRISDTQTTCTSKENVLSLRTHLKTYKQSILEDMQIDPTQLVSQANVLMKYSY